MNTPRIINMVKKKKNLKTRVKVKSRNKKRKLSTLIIRMKIREFVHIVIRMVILMIIFGSLIVKLTHTRRRRMIWSPRVTLLMTIIRWMMKSLM